MKREVIDRFEKLREFYLETFNLVELNEDSYNKNFKLLNEKNISFNEFKKEIEKIPLSIKDIFINPNESILFRRIVIIYRGFILAYPYCEFKKGFNIIKEILNDIDKFFKNGCNLKKFDMFIAESFQIVMVNLIGEILFDYMDKESFCEFGTYVYTKSDFGSNFIFTSTMEKIFYMSKNKNLLKEKFKNGKIEVFRGMGSLSTSEHEAYSWTLDIEVAKFFAQRFEKDTKNIRIIKGIVDIENVYEYIEGAEKEVVVVPGSVYSIEEININ